MPETKFSRRSNALPETICHSFPFWWNRSPFNNWPQRLTVALRVAADSAALPRCERPPSPGVTPSERDLGTWTTWNRLKAKVSIRRLKCDSMKRSGFRKPNTRCRAIHRVVGSSTGAAPSQGLCINQLSLGGDQIAKTVIRQTPLAQCKSPVDALKKSYHRPFVCGSWSSNFSGPAIYVGNESATTLRLSE